MQKFIIIGTVLIFLGRLTVPGHGASWHGSYEALAHIFIGMLLLNSFQKTPTTKLSWRLLIGLSLFEIFMAILQNFILQR